jgi:hypothetical protein
MIKDIFAGHHQSGGQLVVGESAALGVKLLPLSLFHFHLVLAVATFFKLNHHLKNKSQTYQ